MDDEQQVENIPKEEIEVFLVVFVRQIKEYILTQTENLFWGIKKNLVDKVG